MNRSDLQALAGVRVQEASALVGSGLFAGGYYLLGYAVECAFKSCIAKEIHEHDFPDRKLLNESHTHDLQKLLNLSGLKTQLEDASAVDPDLATNWAVVKDWSEQARYELNIAEKTARDLLTAITDADHGVLPWLKKYW